jgi:hypothetical protein
MPRIQALVFSYIFDSADVKAADLDLSARRLSAFVTGSCGSGYPLMESLADLFGEVPEDRSGGRPAPVYRDYRRAERR